MTISSAPANESSPSKCARCFAWKQALNKPLSMRFSETFKGLPPFNRNFAHAKFLRKGHSLKGSPNFCKPKLPHKFEQKRLPEGPPDLSPKNAHAPALILQSIFCSQNSSVLPWDLWIQGGVSGLLECSHSHNSPLRNSGGNSP